MGPSALRAVTLSLAPMTADWATRIAGWRYERPFDVYNPSEDTAGSMLDGNHLAVLDDGELVGFVGLGGESRVPGGPEPREDVTDVGVGIRPDLLSERLGTRTGELVLETLQMAGHTALRASVLASNERSIHLAVRLGFHETGSFVATRDGERFVVLERELLG
ncbi:MAG TPA: GNAT family protein [Acidimicrobiales bacterium]|jgi:RimJ/RimL family protein N-acetyltransferase|nr:GNAT family protein [Acidimicrobiales bacterium]